MLFQRVSSIVMDTDKSRKSEPVSEPLVVAVGCELSHLILLRDWLRVVCLLDERSVSLNKK